MNFQELYHIAECLKDNYEERKAWFPDFNDSDLIIGNDVWVSSQPPCTRRHEYVCDLRQGRGTSEIAGSPDEESPPSSVTPSEATGNQSSCVCIYSMCGDLHREAVLVRTHTITVGYTLVY